MTKKPSKGTIAALISTGLIAFLTITEIVPDEFKDFSTMAVPILSEGIVLAAIWIFVKSDLDTIEGMREKKLRNKMREQIQADINVLEKAIKSGLLLEQDVDKKKRELSEKYEELTKMDLKI